MTGAKANTPSTEFGRSWTWRWSMPRSAKRRSSAAMASGSPAIRRSSAASLGCAALVRARTSTDRVMRGWISADIATGCFERNELLRHLGQGAQAAVPVIGQLGGQAEHPRPIRADHHRQPFRARATRLEPGRTCPDRPTVVRRRPPAQHLGDDPEPVLEPPELIVERDAVAPELRLVPAGTEAQDHATAADLIERLGHLGQHCRVPERGGEEARSRSSTRCVDAARADSSVHDSHAPVQSPSGSPNPTWSETQTASKPTDSAACAIARMSDERGVWRSIEPSTRFRFNPEPKRTTDGLRTWCANIDRTLHRSGGMKVRRGEPGAPGPTGRSRPDLPRTGPIAGDRGSRSRDR